MNKEKIIKAEAIRLGFSLIGITSLDPSPHASVYQDWIKQGKHASMSYLASPRGLQSRLDPHMVFSPARSIIMLAAAYPAPLNSERRSLRPGIAAYAVGRDYHLDLPEKLRQLAHFIQSNIDPHLQYVVYTDTGPVLERDLAQRAGLGWIGKNTCLIHPKMGSYFFIAEIFVSTHLEPDPAFAGDLCGNCRRCVDACPTGCISEDRTLDSASCISYLTIENRADMPLELRQKMGGWVFGCDICQQVCPWNEKAGEKPRSTPLFNVLPAINDLNASDILGLSPQEFNLAFKNTPIQRAKRSGLLRNAVVATGNLRSKDALPQLIDLLLHEQEALVRAHAAWAIGQFHSSDAIHALKTASRTEIDPAVLTEIEEALKQF